MSWLGILEGFELRGTDIVFYGSNWVAVALDRDDAMLVTSLHDVHPDDLDAASAALVVSSRDLYEVELLRRADGYEVRVALPDRTIRFRCRPITRGTRYYTESEIRETLSALARLPPDDLHRYRAAAEARRHLVASDPCSMQRPLGLSDSTAT